MGYSALITGASTGIGRDLALALARQGAALTLLDIDLEGVKRTAAEVQQATGVACAVERLDVTDSVAQDAAIKAHVARYGDLSLVVLNAGIAEQGDLFDPSITGWQRCHDVNVTAVMHGVRSAVFAMKSGGTIICVASAGGIFPMPVAPVYSAAKAGVVQFVRSIGPGLEKRRGIRVLALCPEFIDTPLVRRVMVEDPPTAKRMLGSLDIKLLPPAAVTRLALDLLADKSHKGGTAALLRQDGTVEYPFKNTLPGKGATSTQPGSSTRSSSSNDQAGLAAWAGAQHRPATYRKWQVHTLSPDFVKATRLVSAPCPHLVPAGQLLVRRVYAGINASDINFTSGRYFGSPRAAAARLPFDSGFEAVSVVAAVGEGVKGFSPGDVVASFTYDAFGEYGLLPTSQALPAPAPRPEVVALLTSGLTASIAFEQCGPLSAGQTVLVTAAAGGTGQFAVQLAKLAGCHVIATAGGPHKVALCKRLGADRVVDYKAEKLKDVLKKEYPKGVDVVYESVGGDMFSAAVDGLADMGKLIVIGMMGSYAEGWPVSQNPGLPEKLLWKSASMHGFFLTRHARHWRRHLSLLLGLWQSGRLQVMLDPVPFIGIESVAAAVAHLQSGKSIGKVVVQVAADLPQGAAPSRHTAQAKM